MPNEMKQTTRVLRPAEEANESAPSPRVGAVKADKKEERERPYFAEPVFWATALCILASCLCFHLADLTAPKAQESIRASVGARIGAWAESEAVSAFLGIGEREG